MVCKTQLTVADSDAFEIFERFTLHRLCKAFEAGRPGH